MVATQRSIDRRSQKRTTRRQAADIIQSVAGFAPYEKRVMEFIKIDTSASLKKALKFAKARLGTHRSAKRKRDAMVNAIEMLKKK